MKRIIICNTYYQVIFSIQLKNTIFKYDYITLLISDHSNNTKSIVNKMIREKKFEECYFVQTKSRLYGAKKINDKIKVMLDAMFGMSTIHNSFLKNVRNKYYDEIISFNYALDIDSYYAYLYKYNPKIKCSMMEEGLFSYDFSMLNNVEFKKKRDLISAVRKVFRKTTVLDSLKNFYCYFTAIYNGTLIPIQVPKIEINSKTANDLKNIFDLGNKLDGYTQKYIFFTSVYDFEGGKPVGEYELVCKVADLVGKDNLLVKTHPRDTRSIYTDNGFNVDKNSSIPWEAIQLSGDFSDKVFMTINSSSVLSGSTMSEKPVRTYYMYKLCDISGNESCKRNARDIESLLQNDEMKDVLRTVHIAEKLEDILG